MRPNLPPSHASRTRTLPPSARRRASCRGFTLIEMLVVIAIIALLAAILIPSLNKAMDSSKRASCASHLRQVGLAITQFAMKRHGFLPAFRHGGWNGTDTNIPDGPPTGDQWAEIISPFLGQETSDINQQDVAAITRGCPAWKGRKDVVQFRTKHGFGMNPYPGAGSSVPRVNVQTGAIQYPFEGPLLSSNRVVPLDALKSPSTTILVGDSVDWHLSLQGGPQNGNWWVNPAKPYGYESGHPNRHGKNANYLHADGSVMTLTPNQALARLRNPTTAQ